MTPISPEPRAELAAAAGIGNLKNEGELAAFVRQLLEAELKRIMARAQRPDPAGAPAANSVDASHVIDGSFGPGELTTALLADLGISHGGTVRRASVLDAGEAVTFATALGDPSYSGNAGPEVTVNVEAGGIVLVWFEGELRAFNPGILSVIGLTIDGAGQTSPRLASNSDSFTTARSMPNSAAGIGVVPHTFALVPGLAAGDHIFKLVYASGDAGVSAHFQNRRISAISLGA